MFSFIFEISMKLGPFELIHIGGGGGRTPLPAPSVHETIPVSRAFGTQIPSQNLTADSRGWLKRFGVWRGWGRVAGRSARFQRGDTPGATSEKCKHGQNYGHSGPTMHRLKDTPCNSRGSSNR